MKKIFSIMFLMAVTAILFTSCDEQRQSSDQKLGRQQEQMQQEAIAQTGMPAITKFQERKLMKQILELRDQENLICYAYLVNEMNGSVGQFLGKCIGYGLPYATQYTSPLKFIDDPNAISGASSVVLPQADPNGLFMPQSADGTWVLLIDPETNESRPVYVEPKVMISPFPLHKMVKNVPVGNGNIKLADPKDFK